MKWFASFVALLVAAHAVNAAQLDLQLFLPPDSVNAGTGAAAAAYAEGLAQTRSNDLPTAVISFSRAVVLDPRHAAAQHMMGLCYWMEGNLREGTKYLMRASRADRPLPESFLALATMSIQRGRSAEAVGWYRKALSCASEEQQQLWTVDPYFKPIRDAEKQFANRRDSVEILPDHNAVPELGPEPKADGLNLHGKAADEPAVWSTNLDERPHPPAL